MFWDGMRGFWGAMRRLWDAMRKFWGGVRSFWENTEVLWVLGWIGGDRNVLKWKEGLLGCSEDVSGYSEELLGVQGVFGVTETFGGDAWIGGDDDFLGCKCGHFGGSGFIWGAVWLFGGADSSSPRQLDEDVFVELDVGSEGNGDEAQLGGVLRDLLAGGSIASYLTSPQGFQFRRLGAGEPGRGSGGSLKGFWGAL